MKTPIIRGLSCNSRSRPAAVAMALVLSGIFPCAGQRAAAADVSVIGVVKGQNYEQSGASLVTLENQQTSGDYDPLEFEAFADAVAADSLVSGTLQLPGGATVPLVRDEPGDFGLQYSYETDELLDLNTTRPSGSHTLNLVTKNDGARSVTLNLSGDTYPVPIPEVTNWTALQSITHSAAATVQWPSMNGTAQDFVMLSVRDENDSTVFETPNPGALGALDGTATQGVIPANTLQPGRTYEGEVLFVKVIQVDTTYVYALSGYYRATGFYIRTAALPGAVLNSQLETVVPPSDQWGVPCDSAVTFRFTQPMNTSPANRPITWSGTNQNPTTFTYQWLDGNRVLHCKFPANLPADQDVAWSLNLSGFKDANGHALGGTEAGYFHTSSDTPDADAADVDGCYLTKIRGYRQTGATPEASGMFGCDVAVEMPAFNRVKEPAIFTIDGNGFSGRLEPDEWGPELFIEATYASKADLDAYFPNGSFTFSLPTLTAGTQTITLDIGATDDYPAAPKVINIAALQAADPAADTTITWDTLAGWSSEPGVGGSFIECEVSNDQGNEVFYSGPEDPGLSASQAVIPAGTLWPGRTYRVELSFTKIKDLDATYVNYDNGCGFQSVTEFTIKTTGTPEMPVMALERAGDGMNLNFSGGEPQRSYVVETSSDLIRWAAQEERWIADAAGGNSYYDADARYLSKRWYRLRDRAADEDWIQPPVSIQGTVWTDATHTAPVAGAVVGTDLDGRTTTTDAAGRFFLETDSLSGYGGAPYTIKVTSGGTTKNFGPWLWGDRPREQHFEMQ